MTQLNLFSEAKGTAAEEVKIISAESGGGGSGIDPVSFLVKDNVDLERKFHRLDGSVMVQKKSTRNHTELKMNPAAVKQREKRLKTKKQAVEDGRQGLEVKNSNGLLAEKLFEVLCVRNSINHYQPTSPSDVVDCVANFHGKLQRVQVKYNTPKSRGTDWENYRRTETVIVKMTSGNSGKAGSRFVYYSKASIDKLILFNPETELFYDIPIPTEEELKYYTDIMKNKYLAKTFSSVSREDYYNNDLWGDKINHSRGNRGKYNSYGITGASIFFLEDFILDINKKPDKNEKSLYSPEMIDSKVKKLMGSTALFPPKWRGLEVNLNA
jgi:hypothetical protein